MTKRITKRLYWNNATFEEPKLANYEKVGKFLLVDKTFLLFYCRGTIFCNLMKQPRLSRRALQKGRPRKMSILRPKTDNL